MIAGLDPAAVAAFLGAGIALNLAPGADVMFATASGLSGGPRAGIAAAAGVSLGALTHAGLAALGLSALLAASPLAFDVLRGAGAAYLVYLAVRAWRARPEPVGAEGATRLARALSRGFLTNVLNPKTALFIFALLPQFTAPERGAAWVQILVLGALFATTGFVITGAYGWAAGWFGTKLTRHARLLSRISAAVYVALAARLVVATARG